MHALALRALTGTLQGMVLAPDPLTNLNAQELREMVTQLMAQVGENAKTIVSKDREILYRQTKTDQLTHEMAVLKRWKFGRSREQLDQAQASLLDETIDADIAAIEQELQNLTPASKLEAETRKQPKRAALPPELPRVEMHHEPESSSCTTPGCGCTLKRIGEDISEKLDYTPGLFTVERHIRGKWACAQCQALIQAPVPAQIIDKGIPTAGLLAQVLVSTQTICLCTGKKASLPVPGWRCRARPWPNGWASAGFSCSRWSMS